MHPSHNWDQHLKIIWHQCYFSHNRHNIGHNINYAATLHPNNKPPCMFRVWKQPENKAMRLFHDHQPSSGPTAPLLILVSTSSAPFLLITGLLRVPWQAEHGFEKTSLQPPSALTRLLASKHSNPNSIQSHWPFFQWCLLTLSSSKPLDGHLAQTHSITTFL